ncbi:SRPBCC family protein [Streptomyces sp. NPDC006251]|uniref:type II toxin-antitoxin system RatA family toxin n=1 Tax=Streptomyces sp. NPDC006251 TaxID=3155718 RepID=UPI0033B421C4
MQSVTIDALIHNRAAAEVFDTVSDFARYPALVEAVRAVRVDPPTTDGALPSHWEVYFRNGILRWSESDRLDRENLTITFEQTEGDFDVFRGEWILTADGEDTVLSFRSEFDFGVPSLASIIDPVAIRVLTENMEFILLGLFDEQVTFRHAASSLDRSARVPVPS